MRVNAHLGAQVGQRAEIRRFISREQQKVSGIGLVAGPVEVQRRPGDHLRRLLDGVRGEKQRLDRACARVENRLSLVRRQAEALNRGLFPGGRGVDSCRLGCRDGGLSGQARGFGDEGGIGIGRRHGRTS